MNRHERLKALFWALASSLPLTTLQAGEGTLTATNGSNATLTAHSSDYSAAAGFNFVDLGMNNTVVGVSLDDRITLDPGSYNKPLRLISGGFAATVDFRNDLIFANSGSGKMLVTLDSSNENMNFQAAVVSTKPTDELIVDASSGTYVTINERADLSNFRSILRFSQAGAYNSNAVAARSDVMTAGGGQIILESTSGRTIFGGPDWTNLGADGSGLEMEIQSGATAEFQHRKVVYADLSGAGTAHALGDVDFHQVDNFTGDFLFQGGTSRLYTGTSANISRRNAGEIILAPTTNATYSGDFSWVHNNRGLYIESGSNTATLTGAFTNVPFITINSGTLELADNAPDIPYNGSGGTLKLNLNTSPMTLASVAALSGAIGLEVDGNQSLSLTQTDAMDNTGAITLTGTSTIDIDATQLGANFLASSSPISIATGCDFDLSMNADKILTRDISGAGNLTVRAVPGRTQALTLDGSVDVDTITMTGDPNSGNTLSLVLNGTLSGTTNIVRDNARQSVTLNSVGGGGTIPSISGTGPVNLGTSANVAFSTASALNHVLNVGGTSRVELFGDAATSGMIGLINLTSSTATLVLNPNTSKTYGADTFTGTARYEINGDGTSSRGVTITGVQSLTGDFIVDGGYVDITAQDALANTSTVQLKNAGELRLSAAQDIPNLASPPEATDTLVAIGAGDLELQPTQSNTYSGRITSSGGKLIHRSTQTQILDGDLTDLNTDIDVILAGTLELNGATKIPDGGTLYILNDSATLRFGSGGVVSLDGDSVISYNQPEFSGSTVQPAATCSKATMLMQGTAGRAGILVGANNATFTAGYGRQITVGGSGGNVEINNTGGLVKEGFGTFRTSRPVSTTHDPASVSAITINKGTVVLEDPAVSGSSGVVTTGSDIFIGAEGRLDYELNGHRQMDRSIEGDGDLYVSNIHPTNTYRLDINTNGKIKHTGDFIVGDRVTVRFISDSCEWEPGAHANIEISDTATFSLQGSITPQGSVFNPHFVSGTAGGSVSTMGTGATINMASGVDYLIVGSADNTLQLSGNQPLSLNIPADKRLDLRYRMTAAGNNELSNSGAGMLSIEGNSLADFQGIVTQESTGHIWLKDATLKQTFTATRFHFGDSASALTTFELTGNNSTTLGEFSTLLAATSGQVEKRGTGRLIFDKTPGVSDWGGDFHVREGTVEWHRTSRASSHNTTVYKGAQLNVWRDFGSNVSVTDLTLGHLTLNSGATLLITDRDWDTPAVAIASDEGSQVVLSEFDAGPASEIIFVVAPSHGITGVDAQTFTAGSTMLKIEEDWTGGSSGISAPIYIRLAPAVNDSANSGEDFVDNTVFPLIEFANAASASAFANKVKLRPSIRALSSGYARGQSVTHPSTLFAQLYLGQDSGDSSAKYLVAHINDTGFAPGLRAAEKTDFRSTTYAGGTYTTGYFLESLMQQDFAAYSPLDSLLASGLGYDQRALNHLTPASYAVSEKAFGLSMAALQPLMTQAVVALSEQQRWASVLDNQQQEFVCRAIERQQNLRSDIQLTSKGRYTSWKSHVQGLSFQSQDAAHQLDADIVGVALKVSNTLAIGYQHTNAQQKYGALDGHISGAQHKHYGSGFIQMRSQQGTEFRAQSTLSWAQNQHQRHIALELAPGLSEQWEARSTFNVIEAQQEAQAQYAYELAQGLSMQPGMSVTAQLSHTPKHDETGAGNLNLVVDAHTHGFVLATPTLALDYRKVSEKGFFSSRVSLGYQSLLMQQNELSYGLKDYELREKAFAAQPEALSGWVIGHEVSLMMQHGLSAQMGYQLNTQRQQAHISLEYVL